MNPLRPVKRYLFPADYMADPSVHVFDGRIYIYPSHDRDCGNAENDNGDQYVMKDYHVLRIDGDPLTGEVVDCGCALKLEDIPWAWRQLWDCDVAERDGRYYLYFPAKDRNGVFRTGVAVADSPEGPFVPEPDPIRGSYSIDCCVLREGDGHILYFGGIWGGQLQRYRDNLALEAPRLPEGAEPALSPRAVRLSADMRQFAEAPRAVELIDVSGKPLRADDPHRFFEASWVFRREGKWYFTYSTGDSHLLCWAVGADPWGPFTYGGVMLTPVVGWTTHHSVVEWRGRWYLFHHDSAPSGGKSWLRSLKVCELAFDAAGGIVPIEGLDG
ncbi:MAG: glycoside hydrolase family 43 protein [Kiritimatiellia bacterium]